MSQDDIYTQLGQSIAAHISRHFGGQLVYMPKAHSLPDDLDRCINAQFNGFNHAILADKFGISVIRVYQAVKKVHRAAKPKPSSRDHTSPTDWTWATDIVARTPEPVRTALKHELTYLIAVGADHAEGIAALRRVIAQPHK